ncbi:sugar O-acetyltransferase [Lapidilactobacillus luobeiensis]|uniref:sugar O-acetyltransferase n=1 Tax=Lapidilactobacillus luobeiensis TaxID=2950371 RepID=UPI0021C35B4E|nr:sugar O-acetyltransferase [Lapidilactobacillus luobeiensis]
MTSERTEMLAGHLYYSPDPELVALRQQAKLQIYQYNQTAPAENEKRAAILACLIDCPSKDAYFEVPMRMDYGHNVHIGRNFFANYDAIFLDVAPITIGDNVMLAPRVSLYTAGHPVVASVRNTDLEYGHPITIGNNVWLGGNVVVCPGVTIGNNVVVGAGAVVTKDIPDNVVVAGVPAKVIRPITAADEKEWQQQQALWRQHLVD